MIKFRNTTFYILIIGIFSAFIYFIAMSGGSLEAGRTFTEVNPDGLNQWDHFIRGLKESLSHPLALLLAQIITIIIAARSFGWLFTRIGQPEVVGEIIAGIVLGPSLIGHYYPDFSHFLFPVNSLGNLQFLSQIGLILFMFVIGMELDVKILKTKAHEAVVISHASIIVPFALGMGLAYYLYSSFAPPAISFLSFSLFIGISMSITAFPVLARIIRERGIQKTKLGMIVITCAAADDITAWCILAAVIAIVKAGSVISSFYTMGLALIYVFLMLKLIRPFLKRVGDIYTSRENLSRPIVAIFFLVLIISSYLTETIGIHALFGAFMAGAIMPENNRFRSILIEKVEDVALVILLPLFFVLTGLRTQIGLLNDSHAWLITGLIVATAIAGKFLGSALAAKFMRQSWKDSLTIGVLMNTRGLMELIVLNIGYDLGVLSPEIFAMLVIMALFTTVMTGPCLNIINHIFRRHPSEEFVVPKEIGSFKILFSFSNPESGKKLLLLASAFVRKLNENASLTAMHLSLANELNQFNAAEYERESFAPVIEESKRLGQKMTTLFKETQDVEADISNVANQGEFDLLLIGVGQSIFEGSLLGKVLGFTTRIINPEKILNTVTGKEKIFDNSPFDEQSRMIISKSQVPVGIFMDRQLVNPKRILIPIFNEQDDYLIKYGQKLIHNNDSQVTILDTTGITKRFPELKERIRTIEQIAPNHIRLQTSNELTKELLTQYDLMIISLDSWKKNVDAHSLWLKDITSTLVVSR
jgi:Kef-type K+ transport system membrane component KefB